MIFSMIEYKNELEKDIRSETSGHFRRLLISLTAVRRRERRGREGREERDHRAFIV